MLAALWNRSQNWIEKKGRAKKKFKSEENVSRQKHPRIFLAPIDFGPRFRNTENFTFSTFQEPTKKKKRFFPCSLFHLWVFRSQTANDNCIKIRFNSIQFNSILLWILPVAQNAHWTVNTRNGKNQDVNQIDENVKVKDKSEERKTKLTFFLVNGWWCGWQQFTKNGCGLFIL